MDDVDEVPLPEDELDLLDPDEDDEGDLSDELFEAPLVDEPPFEEAPPLDFADEPPSDAPLSEEVEPLRA